MLSMGASHPRKPGVTITSGNGCFSMGLSVSLSFYFSFSAYIYECVKLAQPKEVDQARS